MHWWWWEHQSNGFDYTMHCTCLFACLGLIVLYFVIYVLQLALLPCQTDESKGGLLDMLSKVLKDRSTRGLALDCHVNLVRSYLLRYAAAALTSGVE